MPTRVLCTYDTYRVAEALCWNLFVVPIAGSTVSLSVLDSCTASSGIAIDVTCSCSIHTYTSQQTQIEKLDNVMTESHCTVNHHAHLNQPPPPHPISQVVSISPPPRLQLRLQTPTINQSTTNHLISCSSLLNIDQSNQVHKWAIRIRIPYPRILVFID